VLKSFFTFLPLPLSKEVLLWGNLSLGGPFAHIKNINVHDETLFCKSPKIFNFSMMLTLHESYPF
jgi:hypothetical protein